MQHEVILLIIPAAAAFLVPLFSFRSVTAARTIVLAGFTAAFIYGIALFPKIMDSSMSIVIAGLPSPLGISLFLSPLSLGMVLVVFAAAVLTAMFSLSGPRDEKPKIYVLYSLFVFGAAGIILTTDLFNVFVFLEILGVSAYALVGSGGPASDAASPQRSSGALRYLILGQTLSLLMLVGIGLVYSASGFLSIPVLASFPALKQNFALLSGVLILLPVLMEAKMFPFNVWAGRAYRDSSPLFGASLSAVGAGAAAVLLMRILLIMTGAGSAFGAAARTLRVTVLLLASLSVLTGELAAFRERNIKKLLAYSSIGQMGIAVVGIALGSRAAVAGMLFFLLAHSAAKVLMFFVSSRLIGTGGSEQWRDMKGMGRYLPLSAVLFSIAALSLMGLPLFAGFWGKLAIIRASIETGGLAYFAASAILLGTVIEGIYFFRIGHSLFEEPSAETKRIMEERGAAAAALSFWKRLPPLPYLIPVFFLAAVILILGIYPAMIEGWLEAAGREFSDPAAEYIEQILTGRVLP